MIALPAPTPTSLALLAGGFRRFFGEFALKIGEAHTVTVEGDLMFVYSFEDTKVL